MRCSKVSKQLQLYLDRQLSLDELRALEAHLAICPRCQQDLLLLEEVIQGLRTSELVAEPPDLTRNIMRRIALSTQQAVEPAEEPDYALLRPSLVEILAVVLLATTATVGIFLSLPSLRSAILTGNGHGILAILLFNAYTLLANVNSNTLMLVFWVIGTVLGVWITLILAGEEVRSQWFKAMLDRLPVW
ncbi:anti-sigma factor family protein [Ktedonosporobacter rubrisoli]|nr:anti-sigma factor [Ktedonosporobacter rubrisoli]